MASYIHRMKAWIDTFGDDVRVTERLVELAGATQQAREAAAAALGYLVSRMDLIPDWEESAGVIDDAMVLRVSALLATEKGLGDPPVDLLQDVGRLTNDVEAVKDFLGSALFARFKHYVEGLAEREVRGRTPRLIVDDAKVRRDFFAEVADELKRLPPAPMADPEAVGLKVHNAISKKLGGQA